MTSKKVTDAPGSFASQSSRISHDNVAELKEAFFILDSSESGTVSSAEIRTLFASTIPNLTDEGFDSLLEECRVDGTEPVTFAQFFVLMTTLSSRPSFGHRIAPYRGTAFGLYPAFAPFDSDDSGFVDSSVFFHLMGEKGEKLSERELDDLRLRLERTGFMKKGRVNYKGFLNNLLDTTADKQFL